MRQNSPCELSSHKIRFQMYAASDHIVFIRVVCILVLGFTREKSLEQTISQSNGLFLLIFTILGYCSLSFLALIVPSLINMAHYLKSASNSQCIYPSNTMPQNYRGNIPDCRTPFNLIICLWIGFIESKKVPQGFEPVFHPVRVMTVFGIQTLGQPLMKNQILRFLFEILLIDRSYSH